MCVGSLPDEVRSTMRQQTAMLTEIDGEGAIDVAFSLQ